jgi:serine/threonine protein phosphatase PrpC
LYAEEAERIKKHHGRVFSLRDEPSVARVWLPDESYPGLAMSRSLGDFQLKHYGVISTPQVAYHRITDRDLFIVLATDGVSPMQEVKLYYFLSVVLFKSHGISRTPCYLFSLTLIC